MKSPNILHIFVDQQRFDTLGALNNPVIRTPSLDRLCRNGVVFRQAFTPSPVCVAARCSMIYGQYPLHTGCYENGRMPVDGRHSFMDALTNAGYRTHGIGKCHFTPDRYAMRGFQTREVQEEGGAGSLEHEPYLSMLSEKGYHHLCEPHGVRSEMYYMPQPSPLPPADHPSQWIGDRTLAFLDANSGHTSSPWYLFSSFIHPHPPFTPPSPWHKLYRAPRMPLPNVPDDHAALQTYVNRFQNRYKYRDQGWDPNLVRCIKAYYYACISFVDYQIGRMLDQLDAGGMRDNTLIVFCADHGELLGDYRCFGKRSMHDASARIPLILSRPGQFDGGRCCDVPSSLIDIAPTMLAAAGTNIETHPLDGIDLNVLQEKDPPRDTVFGQLALNNWQEPDPGSDREADPASRRAAVSTYMAVDSRWKYFYSAPDQQDYLFDRLTDPLETRNQAGSIHCRAEADRLRHKLFEHLRAGSETAGIDGENWRVFPKLDVPADPDSGLLVQDYFTPWTDGRTPDARYHE